MKQYNNNSYILPYSCTHLGTVAVYVASAITNTVNQCLCDSVHHFICIYSWLLKLLSPAVVPDSKSCTVAIIKPDAVAHSKANEIIMKVRSDDCCYIPRGRDCLKPCDRCRSSVVTTLPLARFRTLASRSWHARSARWLRLRLEIFTCTKLQRYEETLWRITQKTHITQINHVHSVVH